MLPVHLCKLKMNLLNDGNLALRVIFVFFNNGKLVGFFPCDILETLNLPVIEIPVIRLISWQIWDH